MPPYEGNGTHIKRPHMVPYDDGETHFKGPPMVRKETTHGPLSCRIPYKGNGEGLVKDVVTLLATST